jgi:teichuronic acid biosynthesis glycosyltransferase TuaC
VTTGIRVLMVTTDWPRKSWGGTTTFLSRQAEFLCAAGVDVDVFAFEGARRPGNYARAWLQLRRRLREGGYALVHAQFGQSALAVLPTRLPLVVTFRGDDLLGIIGEDGTYTRAGRLLQGLSRLVARRADAVIVVAEHMKRCLPGSVAAHVLPSGLDLQRFRSIPREEARRHLGLPLDDRLVLFVGRPTLARKRFGLAQQAVEVVARTLPARLMLGYEVPHTQIPWLMNACDVLVCTSMQEGSPNVVKEALACDLPVVSVPVADVPQRLAGIAGCVVCADERPETIAAALEGVLRSGQRIAGRGAVRELDERLLTEQLIGIYRSVLLARHRPRPSPAGGLHAASPANLGD